MLLTVFCLRRDRSELTFSLQVDADFELQNFRALCELESGIPAAESQIVYAQQPLTDNHRSLASYGLKDGDVVVLQQLEDAEGRPPVSFPGLPRIDFSSITVPGTSAQLSQPLPPPAEPPSRPRPAPELPPSPQGLENPALLREMLLANPHELSLLKERNPPLAEALLSGDLEKFSQVLVEQQQDRARREQERIRLFSADPFDLEAQARIEEDIRQQNIEENMTIAMEEAPESFGQVVMLYINCKVNGHPVKAFVDSGAQMTIMSQACAERCNIMRLVDRRWAGIARGVGTQKIIGRVHLAQVQIEGDFLPCSFSILEEQPMDMLLGLDMLKRHQCSIDLKKNVLVIGTTGSQTGFLPEGELPECARLAYGAGREEARPEEVADQELAEVLQKSAEEAENSDQETTSHESPLQPTSGGLKHFPELGLKTNDSSASRLLRFSASAPLGSQAETLKLQATKSLDSPPRRKELPALLSNLSDRVLCADASEADNAERGSPVACPASPENLLAKAEASGCPREEESLPGPDTQGASGESAPCPASVERSQPAAPWLPNATEHHDIQSRRPCPGHEPSPDEPGEPGGQGLPPKGAACFSPASTDAFLGEGLGESGAASLDGGSCSGARETSGRGILGSLGTSSQLGPSEGAWPLPHGLPPRSSLLQPGENPGVPAGISHTRDRDTDAGLSLSAALKELHRLLTVSSKEDSRVSGSLPEEPAPAEVSPESPEVAHSLPEWAGPGLALEAGAEMPEEERSSAQPWEPEALLLRESSRFSFSAFASRSAALSDERCELRAPGLASGQRPGLEAEGQRSPPSPSLEPALQSPFPGGVGASSAPEAERLLPRPAGGPRPPASSSANLDQLVGAGFTPQEAGEALEHAGGNAELALLILLAKNIIVPT